MIAERNSQRVSPRLLVVLVFVLLQAAVVVIFGPYFPLADGTVGHDYSLGFTALLDGTIWFRTNGLLEVPWFTPSFCAGQPTFADPQNGYFSIPQFLSFLVSPLAAAYLLLLLCAAGMFWGSYLLMKKVYCSTRPIAVLVGGLMMFNGFLPHRLMIGHMNFHGFALVPWLALLLLVPVRNRASGLAAGVAGGLVLAYWVQGSFGTLILAGALSVLLLALLAAREPEVLSRFITRGTVAALIGAGLSASKLWAGFAFLSHFQRTYYSLPGAASVLDDLVMIVGALFLPSQFAYELGTPRLKNVQWHAMPHEWAFNFSTVLAPMALALAALLLLRRYRGSGPRAPMPWWRILTWVIFAVGMLWPLAFNFWQPAWHDVIKSIPVLNSASSALRWVTVYIPVLAAVFGLLAQKAVSPRLAHWLAGVVLVATVVQSAIEPRDFYRAQSYAVHPVLLADARLRDGSWVPRIAELGTSSALLEGDELVPLNGNDAMMGGVSQVRCYNPVFGYRLEKFSAAGLRAGSVFQISDGYLNVKDPACYVFPEENNCRPGDRFRADQMEEAKAFVAYHPYRFNMPASEVVAIRVTEATLMLTFGYLAGWGALCIRQWAGRRGKRRVTASDRLA